MSSVYETRFDVIFRKLQDEKLALKKEFDEAYSRDDFRESMKIMENIQKVMHKLSSLESLETPFKELSRVSSRVEDLKLEIEISLEELGKEIRSQDELCQVVFEDLKTEMGILKDLFRSESGKHFSFEFEKFTPHEIYTLIHYNRKNFPSRISLYDAYWQENFQNQDQGREDVLCAQALDLEQELCISQGDARPMVCVFQEEEKEILPNDAEEDKGIPVLTNEEIALSLQEEESLMPEERFLESDSVKMDEEELFLAESDSVQEKIESEIILQEECSFTKEESESQECKVSDDTQSEDCQLSEEALEYLRDSENSDGEFCENELQTEDAIFVGGDSLSEEEMVLVPQESVSGDELSVDEDLTAEEILAYEAEVEEMSSPVENFQEDTELLPVGGQEEIMSSQEYSAEYQDYAGEYPQEPGCEAGDSGDEPLDCSSSDSGYEETEFYSEEFSSDEVQEENYAGEYVQDYSYESQEGYEGYSEGEYDQGYDSGAYGNEKYLQDGYAQEEYQESEYLQENTEFDAYQGYEDSESTQVQVGESENSDYTDFASYEEPAQEGILSGDEASMDSVALEEPALDFESEISLDDISSESLDSEALPVFEETLEQAQVMEEAISLDEISIDLDDLGTEEPQKIINTATSSYEDELEKDLESELSFDEIEIDLDAEI